VKKAILFNPRSAKHKHRIPNSILQIGAAIEGKFEYVFVDGDLGPDPWSTIRSTNANALQSRSGETINFGLHVLA